MTNQSAHPTVFQARGFAHIVLLVGIVTGPLIVAVAVTLLEAYRNEKTEPVSNTTEGEEERR